MCNAVSQPLRYLYLTYKDPRQFCLLLQCWRKLFAPTRCIAAWIKRQEFFFFFCYPAECCLSVGLSWLWGNRQAAQTSCVEKSLFSCVELCIVLWYNRCIVHDNHLISVLLCHMLLMFLMFAAEFSQWGHICKWGSQTVFVYETFRPDSHSSWMYRQLKCNIWTQLIWT